MKISRDDALKLLRGGPEGVAEWNRRRVAGEEIPVFALYDRPTTPSDIHSSPHPFLGVSMKVTVKPLYLRATDRGLKFSDYTIVWRAQYDCEIDCNRACYGNESRRWVEATLR